MCGIKRGRDKVVRRLDRFLLFLVGFRNPGCQRNIREAGYGIKDVYEEARLITESNGKLGYPFIFGRREFMNFFRHFRPGNRLKVRERRLKKQQGIGASLRCEIECTLFLLSLVLLSYIFYSFCHSV